MAEEDNKNVNFDELMEKAKDMQSRMQMIQNEISAMSVEGKAGGGLVSVKIRGNHYATECQIKSQLLPGVEQDSIDILSDLIVAAINNAVDKNEKITRDKIQDLTGDFQMPEDTKAISDSSGE